LVTSILLHPIIFRYFATSLVPYFKSVSHYARIVIGGFYSLSYGQVPSSVASVNFASTSRVSSGLLGNNTTIAINILLIIECASCQVT
uniref:Secreted protein n=1 Tax=Ascaris lumbricoides TaxID=6252 RepID=A0A0M3HGU4_ASCLU